MLNDGQGSNITTPTVIVTLLLSHRYDVRFWTLDPLNGALVRLLVSHF